ARGSRRGDGHVAHRLAGGGAVPVTLAGGDEDDVADGDALLGLALALDDALALGDHQHLVERVRVHLVHRAVLERHDADADLLRVFLAHQGLALHRPHEEVARRGDARIRAHAQNFQAAPPRVDRRRFYRGTPPRSAGGRALGPGPLGLPHQRRDDLQHEPDGVLRREQLLLEVRERARATTRAVWRRVGQPFGQPRGQVPRREVVGAAERDPGVEPLLDQQRQRYRVAAEPVRLVRRGRQVAPLPPPLDLPARYSGEARELRRRECQPPP